MRIRKAALLSLIVFIFSLGLTIPSPAYIMVIDTIQAKAGAVFFPHHRHLASPERQGVALSCAQCHHELNKPENQGQTPQLCSTANCHPPTEEAAEQAGLLYLKDAFHDLCKKCHKDMRRTNPKAPKNCAGCHKKELIPFSKVRQQENLPE